MSLTELWLKNPSQIKEKHIRQIIAFSGEGQLKDGSSTSVEFRNFLSHIPSNLIHRYAEECLTESYPGSGLVLQDIVNQIGSRLGFVVADGRYRGSTKAVGFDGLWMSKDGHYILIEVKTTDTYRIDLDTIVGYRNSLQESNKLDVDKSSVLIVVGRMETGDLEAQVRGSRHAWDIRLISVDALLSLMKIKEEIEDPNIVKRIHEILIPREFTKLDGIIDLLFSTAEDIKQEVFVDEEERNEKRPKFTPVSFHEACIKRLEHHLKTPLLRESRASYHSSKGDIGVICSISRERKIGVRDTYWFAFHPHQRDYLQGFERAFVAFGCGSENQIIQVPFNEFKTWLDGFNITEREDRFYWHIHISKEENKFLLYRKKSYSNIDLSKYLI